MAILSKKPIISRDTLREIADVRLLEAETLFKAEHYAGAVYLGGHAVECYLKVAICVTLRWDALRGTFKTHDLDGLVLYSGFDEALRSNGRIGQSFAKIVATWKVEGDDDMRYRNPSEFDKLTARLFFECVTDPEKGVIPWLRKLIS